MALSKAVFSLQNCKTLSSVQCRFKGIRSTPGFNPCLHVLEDVKKKCSKAECILEYPRFDDIHYKSSDKSKKEYQQTWCEPPELVIKEKNKCLEPLRFEAIDPERRARQKDAAESKNKDSCKNIISDPEKRMKLDLMGCQISVDNTKVKSRCPKIQMPGCKLARDPPECTITNLAKPCKTCTPYPSFSECQKGPIKMLPITECRREASLCEAFREFLKKSGIEKPAKIDLCPPKKRH